MQYQLLLVELAAIAHLLQLWCIDPLLHCELSLKLACLQEAKAERREKTKSRADGDTLFLSHDRSQLLQCREELERGLRCIALAQQQQEGSEGGASLTDVKALHVELLFAHTRVQVKLSSTAPPSSEELPPMILTPYN